MHRPTGALPWPLLPCPLLWSRWADRRLRLACFRRPPRALQQKKRGRPKLSTSTAGAQALRVSRTTPLIIEQPPYGTDQGGPLSAPAFSSSFSRSSVGGGGGGVARINLLPSAQPPAPLSSSAPPETFFTPDYSVASPPFSTATPVVPPRPRPPRPLSMILLTTTDFFLLRASDSSVEVLGKPSTALQRSWMSDLLPSEDLLALFPLCQWLVSPPGVHLSTDPGTEAAIEGATWPELTLPAEGTPYPEKEVRMHKADGSLVAVNLRMHLGRGAGLDFRCARDTSPSAPGRTGADARRFSCFAL